MKNVIITLLKFSFATGLIYWLVNSGKLDFTLLSDVIKDPTKLLICGFGMLLVLMLANFRYSIILSHKSLIRIPFLRLLKYNWIGMFFNSVLPGSVSGDFVKIFYIKNEDKSLSNKFMLGSVLIDRILGLFGLILSLGFFTIFNYTELSALSLDIKKLLDLNLLLFTLVVLGLFSLFYFQNLPHKLLIPLQELPVLHKILPKLLLLWDELCEFKTKMVSLTIISIFLQIVSVIIFWFLTKDFSQGDFDLKYALSIVPVGFVAISIPIAPSGLGVGHAAFHTLLEFVGIKNGADLFNIYFFMVLSFNLIGALPYLFSKKISKKDLDLPNKNSNQK
jgi:uncharacterized membrane protein YbhN (UPF0104 family)